MTVKRFQRPCLTCGQLTKAGSYCDTHTPKRVDTPERKLRKQIKYNSEYKRLAKKVRQTATHCWICGQGARADDPFEADHITPGTLQGGLLPAHKTCNAKRGNTPPPQGRGDNPHSRSKH